jgi:hypothetical protein
LPSDPTISVYRFANHEFMESKDITRTRSLTGPDGCSLITTALPPQIASA